MSCTAARTLSRALVVGNVGAAGGAAVVPVAFCVVGKHAELLR